MGLGPADGSRATMGPAMVIVMTPALDEDLRLDESVEDLAIEQFVASLAVEAFIVAILPRVSGLDIERLHPDPAKPGPHLVGRDLTAVGRAIVIGRPRLAEQFRQAMRHVVRGRRRATAIARHSRVNASMMGEQAELAPVARLAFCLRRSRRPRRAGPRTAAAAGTILR